MPTIDQSDTARITRIETMLEGTADRDKDFESRMRRVERIMYLGIGLAASLGSAVGSLAGYPSGP